MRPRIGIGVDYAAAALVTLAVVALPAWAIAIADRGSQWWLVLGLGLTLGLAVPATRQLVRSGRLLSSVGTSVLLLIGVAVATWIAAVIAFYFAYLIETYDSLCGGGIAATIAAIGGLIVFLAVGAWALASPRFVVWAMPLAPVLGFAWALVLVAVIPGGHGYCET